MATYTAPTYGNSEVYQPRAGELAVAYGVVDFGSSKPTDGDILEFLTLPQRAIVLGGYLQGADLDTGSEALQIDVGVTGNTDKYLDGAVLTGDSAELKGGVGILAFLAGELSTNGVMPALSAAENVIGEVIATANDSSGGKLALVMHYTTGRT